MKKDCGLDPPEGTEVSCAPWLGQDLPVKEDDRPTGDRARTPAKGWPSLKIGHPIAPTEFPKGWSVATNSLGPRRDDHEAVTCTPQEEDTGRTVTSKSTATDRGLPPEI